MQGENVLRRLYSAPEIVSAMDAVMSDVMAKTGKGDLMVLNKHFFAEIPALKGDAQKAQIVLRCLVDDGVLTKKDSNGVITYENLFRYSTTYKKRVRQSKWNENLGRFKVYSFIAMLLSILSFFGVGDYIRSTMQGNKPKMEILKGTKNYRDANNGHEAGTPKLVRDSSDNSLDSLHTPLAE